MPSKNNAAFNPVDPKYFCCCCHITTLGFVVGILSSIVAYFFLVVFILVQDKTLFDCIYNGIVFIGLLMVIIFMALGMHWESKFWLIPFIVFTFSLVVFKAGLIIALLMDLSEEEILHSKLTVTTTTTEPKVFSDDLTFLLIAHGIDVFLQAAFVFVIAKCYKYFDDLRKSKKAMDETSTALESSTRTSS